MFELKRIVLTAVAAVAAVGMSRTVQAQNIVGSTTGTTSWSGTPVFATGTTPVTNSGGTTNDNDSWGGNSNGSNGFGALAETFEVTQSGILSTAQMTMAGGSATFNVELYDLGPVSNYPGYQAASGNPPTITQLNGVGGGTYPDLLAANDQFTYAGTATDNVEVLTFQNADSAVQLNTGELYLLSLDPTANADTTWWQRGGLPSAAFNTGEGMNADGVNGLQNFESKTSVRDFDTAITLAPEPAVVSLLGVAALGLISRRRKLA